MGQFVDQDEVIGPDKRRNDSQIGEITGAEDAGCLCPLEARQPRFELREKWMISGHQARRPGACPVEPHCLGRGFDDRRMVRQVEIVVTAE